MEALLLVCIGCYVYYSLLVTWHTYLYLLRVRHQLTSRGGGGYLYVYRGRHESRRYVKIGRATNAVSRLRGQRTANPHGIEVLAVCRVKDAVKAERLVHELLDRWRFNGEWFEYGWDTRCMVMALRQQPLTSRTQYTLDDGRFMRDRAPDRRYRG